MYLGLDLRGGVHFLLQVDMTRRVDQAARRRCVGDLRTLLREQGHPPRRHQPRRRHASRSASATRRRATRRDGVIARQRSATWRCATTASGGELRLIARADAGGRPKQRPGLRAQAEHHHAAQPRSTNSAWPSR
ncbi:MAG: hypothetical protein MZW92_35390 [Comamonadaceae bacterium]|nr:hypothetical protein [Comamonadaceae bacterium]